MGRSRPEAEAPDDRGVLVEGPRFGVLRDWDRLATPVERVFAAPFACSDRDDQKFLDLAYTARADWLVTKDKALLKLARRARRDGLKILLPAAACAELGSIVA